MPRPEAERGSGTEAAPPAAAAYEPAEAQAHLEFLIAHLSDLDLAIHSVKVDIAADALRLRAWGAYHRAASQSPLDRQLENEQRRKLLHDRLQRNQHELGQLRRLRGSLEDAARRAAD